MCSPSSTAMERKKTLATHVVKKSLMCGKAREAGTRNESKIQKLYAYQQIVTIIEETLANFGKRIMSIFLNWIIFCFRFKKEIYFCNFFLLIFKLDINEMKVIDLRKIAWERETKSRSRMRRKWINWCYQGFINIFFFFFLDEGNNRVRVINCQSPLSSTQFLDLRRSDSLATARQAMGDQIFYF